MMHGGGRSPDGKTAVTPTAIGARLRRGSSAAGHPGGRDPADPKAAAPPLVRCVLLRCCGRPPASTGDDAPSSSAALADLVVEVGLDPRPESGSASRLLGGPVTLVGNFHDEEGRGEVVIMGRELDGRGRGSGVSGSGGTEREGCPPPNSHLLPPSAVPDGFRVRGDVILMRLARGRAGGGDGDGDGKKSMFADYTREEYLSKCQEILRQSRWDKMLAEMREYKRAHGHCAVPKNFGTLGGWVEDQRQAYELRRAGKASPMTEVQQRQLEELGFVSQGFANRSGESASGLPSTTVPTAVPAAEAQPKPQFSTRNDTPLGLPQTGNFDEVKMLAALRDFKQTHGHCDVPKNLGALGYWVDFQRQAYRLREAGIESHMTDERKGLLEELGFVWLSDDKFWDMLLDELLELQPGLTEVAQMRTLQCFTTAQLKEEALWVVGQKWLWELQTFKNLHGHCNVPPNYGQLGRWVQSQRRAYKLRKTGKESIMTDERQRLLGIMGFQWLFLGASRPHIGAAPQHFERRAQWVEGLKDVAEWFQYTGDLCNERFRNRLERRWNQRFKNLCDFKFTHGHCNVPPESGELGLWVSKQRMTYILRKAGKESAMTDERLKLLEVLGFQWHSPNVYPPLLGPHAAQMALPYNNGTAPNIPNTFTQNSQQVPASNATGNMPNTSTGNGWQVPASNATTPNMPYNIFLANAQQAPAPIPNAQQALVPILLYNSLMANAQQTLSRIPTVSTMPNTLTANSSHVPTTAVPTAEAGQATNSMGNALNTYMQTAGSDGAYGSGAIYQGIAQGTGTAASMGLSPSASTMPSTSTANSSHVPTTAVPTAEAGQATNLMGNALNTYMQTAGTNGAYGSGATYQGIAQGTGTAASMGLSPSLVPPPATAPVPQTAPTHHQPASQRFATKALQPGQVVPNSARPRKTDAATPVVPKQIQPPAKTQDCRIPRGISERKRKEERTEDSQHALKGILDDLRWNEHFEKLRNFKVETGCCNVPQGSSLSAWAEHQRTEYQTKKKNKKKSQLTTKRISLLEGLGFVWDVQGRKSSAMASSQTAKVGPVTEGSKEMALGSPAVPKAMQPPTKALYSGISQDSLKRHEKNGTTDDSQKRDKAIFNESRWNDLRQFKNDTGLCNIPRYIDKPDCQMTSQRNKWRSMYCDWRRRRTAVIDKERRSILEELGLVWKSPWEEASKSSMI